MANITRIKASGSTSAKKADRPASPKAPRKKTTSGQVAPKKPSKKSTKPFILLRPFVYFGRYLKQSWGEIRQVRWPNRKYTWSMTLAMLVYCAIFLIFIVLLDLLFSFIFNNLFG